MSKTPHNPLLHSIQIVLSPSHLSSRPDPSLGKKIHSETPVPLFSKMSEYPFLKAREGREKQRYDGETRLVVGYRTLPLPHPLAAP